MFFFFVHLSPAASYSQTAPGGVPVMPTGLPPKRYSFPFATTPLRSSFISGTGASRTQRPSALAWPPPRPPPPPAPPRPPPCPRPPPPCAAPWAPSPTLHTSTRAEITIRFIV